MTKKNETPQKRAARLSDEAAAWAEYQAHQQSILLNMTRLRALRLGLEIPCANKPKRKRADGAIEQFVAEIEGKREVHGHRQLRRGKQAAAAQ
jgi:hypothetical protein